MEPRRTYLQAIQEILKDSNRPLSTNEIYLELQKRNLLSFENAKTPHKTISSRIHEEIEKYGDASIFLRIGQVIQSGIKFQLIFYRKIGK
jgi:hypothetical protein